MSTMTPTPSHISSRNGSQLSPELLEHLGSLFDHRDSTAVISHGQERSSRNAARSKDKCTPDHGTQFQVRGARGKSVQTYGANVGEETVTLIATDIARQASGRPRLLPISRNHLHFFSRKAIHGTPSGRTSVARSIETRRIDSRAWHGRKVIASTG